MNGGEARRSGPITASHLYDFTVCEHRITLDFTLDRSKRTPPDEAGRRLMERGLEIERRLADATGYVRVPSQPGGHEAAFEQTFALMKEGCTGIDQGVLFSGRRLAIPDLLRRVDGESSLGSFHYVPGDIKSGIEPRSDQVLQVVFAAALLESIQGRRPEVGFLIMADGDESTFPIEDVWDSSVLALERLEDVADGLRSTEPFLSAACGRCRWSGTCLPDLEARGDLSLVAGMTPTRKRVLRGLGLQTAFDLAALGEEALATLIEGGAPTDGLRSLQCQARAYASGRVISSRRRQTEARATVASRAGARSRTAREVLRTDVDPSLGDEGEHYLVCLWNPLDGGRPGLLGWASRLVPEGSQTHRDESDASSRIPAFDRCEILILASDRAGELAAAARLEEWVETTGGPIYHFGGSVPRFLDWLAVRSIDPTSLGRIEGRLVNLAPLVRRGAYLPVRRYRFEEVAAVVQGVALPVITEAEDSAFVWLQSLRLGVAGSWNDRLHAKVSGQLESLARVKDWSVRAGDPAADTGVAVVRERSASPVLSKVGAPAGDTPSEAGTVTVEVGARSPATMSSKPRRKTRHDDGNPSAPLS